MNSVDKPSNPGLSSAENYAAPATATARVTHTRYLIVALLFIASTLNNADRAILSITGTAIQNDFGIDAITLGYLFASFAWAYMLAQIPGGWLIDRFGSKKVYAVSLFVWSFTTFLQGFVPAFGVASAIVALFFLRICVGIAEGPAYPNNSRVVATWFPAAERGTAAAIFNSSQYAAAVIFTPLMAWITHSFGWPHVYIVMGLLGIVLSGGWLLCYHQPADHPWANRAELDYITRGGALVDIENKGNRTRAQSVDAWACIKELLSSRMMLGIYAGQYFITTIVYFFLTWFPIYLVKALHMPILKAGLIASTPAIGGFLGGILGGILSDALLRRGYSTTVARKVPIVVGLLLSTSIVACNWASTQTMVVVIMGLAFFGKGVGSLGWTVVSDTSPKEAAGLSGALFNTFANVAGITTPIVIGYIVQLTGSFDGALIYVAANAALAVFSFLFIVGKIERVQLTRSLRHPASAGGAQ
ncbi:ACS family glucarate transporter-like MFS transporter [Paraburkholderia sp. BL27I4N3]|uniref:MFS transporter n=1 Tax=Paraburkholderia sp. BL27I4N3 TaxID=1938805 RepID=UPI000E270EB4|nr:MFS transporter [Paraburkholderia sp. BL27I4N3]REE07399.1 ACS family glucarate transporter-like MFS transporter [Paraburkholderia sp. BL27I4N3]